MKKGIERLVLLDAHAIIHRAYHALPDFSSSKGEPTGGLYGLSAMLIKIIADLKPDYLAAAYDLPKPTYRHEAYKDYKAGRAKADEELVAQLKRSRDVFAAFGIPIYDKEGFEADDILGTIVEKLKKDKNIEVVIASGDMDTLQLVSGKQVRVFTLKKGMNDTILYDEEAVKTRFGFGPERIPDFKGLSGDPSDNIGGVPGIGEKTATTLIQKFGAVEDVYKTLKKNKKKFEEAGIKSRIVELLEKNKEEAEFSKMLATIRRDAPIDFSLPEKLWKESFDQNKITALFNELEFRTLGARLREVLKKNGNGDSRDAVQTEINSGENAPNQLTLGGVSSQNISGRELKETALALWLINSNLTDPKAEDIFNFAKTRDWQEARGAVFTELEKRNLAKVFNEIEKPLVPVIEKMEKRGIKIDAGYLTKLSKEYHGELAKIEKKIWKLAGEEFNVSSPKQLGQIIFGKLGLKASRQKKTGTGALSTKESELQKLNAAHPIVPLVLEYRELDKLLGTYIDTIPALMDKKNRLHSHFIQAGTTTGRMASQNPNIQNIPIKSELGRNIRHGFISEKGYLLAGFDYSQIELRIAAFMSGDEKLIKIFKDGSDVHAAVASAVFNVPLSEVTHEMRRRAKVINFGILYGMGVAALQKNLNATREEAQKFLDGYFQNFSTLAGYLDGVKVLAARRGYTETFFGRRRYFESINSRIPYIRAEAERMAVNAPFQGTCADIIKLAMVKIDARIRAEGLAEEVFPILQVHDELVFEIKEDKVVKAAPIIKQCMEETISPREMLGIPIVANASIGLNWGSMEPLGEKELGK